MEYLEINEIREFAGLKVQCLEIDPDWEKNSEDVCGYHGCAFEDYTCERIACCFEERGDDKNVYFKKIE